MAITNPDNSALATAAKYANPTNIIGEAASVGSRVVGGVIGGVVHGVGSAISGVTNFLTGGRNVPSSEPMSYIQKGATPVTFSGESDLRVKLKVPRSYLTGPAAGPFSTLQFSEGIIFPYTPQLGVEHKANYSSVNPTHSNYTQYYYKNSSVGEISLTAKWTVQNEYEAGIYLGVVHLLRALTKMKFGDDANAGSPPPVCRLYAYGDFMFNKTPVVISSFKIDLPIDVDYITTGNGASSSVNAFAGGLYGKNAVPSLSTFSIIMNPVYSRDEMRRATVAGFLSGSQKKEGFL
jgi:hypothetical protein